MANANPSDNTDMCLVNMGRAPESSRVRNGYSTFPANVERATHCHGFAWTDNEIDVGNIFNGNNLIPISMYDHLYQRGYVKNVPGAPMCACLEQMPVVSRADCTEMTLAQNTTFAFASSTVEVVIDSAFGVDFRACCNPDGPNNNLESYYTRLVNEDRAARRELAFLQTIVVGNGNCPAAIEEFVGELLN